MTDTHTGPARQGDEYFRPKSVGQEDEYFRPKSVGQEDEYFRPKSLGQEDEYFLPKPEGQEDGEGVNGAVTENVRFRKLPAVLAGIMAIVGIVLNIVYAVIEMRLNASADWEASKFSDYQEAMGRCIIACCFVSVIAYAVLFLLKKVRYTLFFPAFLFLLAVILIYIAIGESKQTVVFWVPTEMRGFAMDDWGTGDLVYDEPADTYLYYGYDSHGHYFSKDLGSNPGADEIRSLKPSYVSDDPIMTRIMPWACALLIPTAIMLGCMLLYAGKCYRWTLLVSGAAGIGASVLTIHIFGKALAFAKCSSLVGLNCAWYAAAVILFAAGYASDNEKQEPKKAEGSRAPGKNK